MLFYREQICQEEEGSESEAELEEEMEGREEGRSLEGRTLALTLEEVRHIRTALTRAELEVTPQSSSFTEICQTLGLTSRVFHKGHFSRKFIRETRHAVL